MPKKSSQSKVSKSSLRPLGDRVVVEPFEEDQLSAKNDAGIIIPDTAEQEAPQQGKIIAVGEGRRAENGERIPLNVKKGDKVIYSKFGYDTVTMDDKEYYILREDSILAVIE